MSMFRYIVFVLEVVQLLSMFYVLRMLPVTWEIYAQQIPKLQRKYRYKDLKFNHLLKKGEEIPRNCNLYFWGFGRVAGIFCFFFRKQNMVTGLLPTFEGF